MNIDCRVADGDLVVGTNWDETGSAPSTAGTLVEVDAGAYAKDGIGDAVGKGDSVESGVTVNGETKARDGIAEGVDAERGVSGVD